MPRQIIHVRINPHYTHGPRAMEKPTVRKKPSMQSFDPHESKASSSHQSPNVLDHADKHKETTKIDKCGDCTSGSGSSNVVIQFMKERRDRIHDDVPQNGISCEKIVFIISVIIVAIAVIVASIILAVLLTIYDTCIIFVGQRGPAAFLRWNTTGRIVAGAGSGGVTGNPVINPLGFTFDETQRIYIVEFNGHRVTRWVREAVNGTVVAGAINGIASSAPNGLYVPHDILLESDGGMYISDRGNNRLQLWSKGSSTGRTVAGFGSNTSIHLNTPASLCRDMNTGEIYIASYDSHVIMSYPSGSVFGISNSPGNTAPQLKSPEGLAFDSFTNSLIISNGQGHSLVRWKIGESNWTLIAGVPGVAGTDDLHFNRPIGLDLDPMGNIYVAEYDNRRVRLFMNGESRGITIVGTGVNGTSMQRVGGVKLDNQLNLYVSGYEQNRVMMFARY